MIIFFRRVDQTVFRSDPGQGRWEGNGFLLPPTTGRCGSCLRLCWALMPAERGILILNRDAYSVVDYEYDNFTIRKINSREPVNV